MKKNKKISKAPKTNIETVRRVFGGLEKDNKFWKPKVGENVIRVLPSNREDGNFAYHSQLHHEFKVEGQGRAFPCMSVFNKPCPVCKVISYFDTESDPDIKELIGKLTPRHAYLMNILDRTNKSDNTVLIFSAAKTVMREIMQYMNDEEYGDITDPDEGRDVKIKRVGEALSTRYSTRVSPKITAIDVEDWEENMFNLEAEAYREIPTTKKYISYLKANFGEVLDINGALELDNEDEDGEKPAKKKKPKKPVTPAADEVEEDEEDSDEDEDEL